MLDVFEDLSSADYYFSNLKPLLSEAEWEETLSFDRKKHVHWLEMVRKLHANGHAVIEWNEFPWNIGGFFAVPFTTDIEWRVTRLPMGMSAEWGTRWMSMNQAGKNKALAWELMELTTRSVRSCYASLQSVPIPTSLSSRCRRCDRIGK